MAKTDPLDPAVPAGSEDPKLGDNRIRELARAVAELLNVDHYMGTDGGSGTGYDEDAAGEHSKVTLRVASAPTIEANKGYVYSKDVDGKAELFYKDEDSNEIQLTSGGEIPESSLADFAASIVSTLATGTAPFTLVSTTKVTNLNADKVDGYDISAYSGGESYTFPGGLIMKHGSATSTTDGLETFTFGTAFPNACISVTLTRQTEDAQSPLNVNSMSAANFKIDRYNGIDGNAPFYWQAFGW